MPQVFCPNCDKKLAVPDRLAGKKGQCPRCKFRFDVPAEEEIEEHDFEVVEDEPEPDQEAAAPSRGVREGRDESPRRARSRDDADDDDRPSRRRRDEDEDEPPRPRKRTSRAGPRRRRREYDGGSFWTSPVGLASTIGGGVALLSFLAAVLFPPLLVVPFGLGCLLASVGQIWFIIVAFQDDVMQGILCWAIPGYAFYYMLTNWEGVKNPVLTQAVGFLMAVGGICAGAIGSSIWAGVAAK